MHPTGTGSPKIWQACHEAHTSRLTCGHRGCLAIVSDFMLSPTLRRLNVPRGRVKSTGKKDGSWATPLAHAYFDAERAL